MKTMHLLMMTGAALMLAPLANAQNQPSSIWNGGSVMTDLSAPRAIGIHVLRINDIDETARYSNSDTRTGRTPGTRGTVPGVTNGLKTVLRVYDEGTVSQTTSLPRDQGVAGAGAPSDVICNLASLAEHGEIAPNTDGGTLNPVAFANPTTVNSSGRIAFNSEVDGSPRNQGVFIGNSDGTLDAIAIGCGGLGGSGDTTSLCGDPSPIGGNFSGFFFGTGFTPDINDAGDVLFFSDVNGGSSRRGLFLYRAASQDITKVAVIGDASPIGGTFGAVGPGSLNNNGEVVFLASPVGTIDSNFFMWNNGVVTKVAAIGDPAPGGGTFSFLGTESLGFADGTNIPFGPVPDINDSEQISFRAIVSGGITDRGIIVRTGGVDQWYVKVPDPTPAGGTYFDMQAASINNAGQIAFFADYRPTPDTFNSGWFAGAPGSWRKVIAFFDPVDGGQCLGLAFSRNPMQTIDDEGNVVFWTNLDSNGTADRLVLGLADGSLLIAARRGDPTPIGGTFGGMDAWPAAKGDNGTLNVATPGAENGALSAHMVFSRCPDEAQTIEVLETFDYPGTGNLTRPQKINDHGVIAGIYLDSSGVSRGFFRSPGGDFSTPIVEPNDTGNLTEVRGVNNKRIYCGDYVGSDGAFHGFFRSYGTFTEFDVPGGSATQIFGINNVGDFAGDFLSDAGIFQAFVSIGGTITPIDIPDVTFSGAYQLNATNQVVGYYTDSAGINHGFSRDSDGTLTFPIDPSGSTGTILFGNNDQNWAVGRYTDSSGLTHGLFFIPPDDFVTFDYPGSTFTSLNGINAKGYICGRYVDEAGIEHGILAKAKPGTTDEARGQIKPNIPKAAVPVRPTTPSPATAQAGLPAS